MSHRHEPAGSPGPRLRIDRIACTGKGICASLLPEAIELDEWGYPILDEAQVDPEMGDIAISLCPARALYWAAPPAGNGLERQPVRRQLAPRRLFASRRLGPTRAEPGREEPDR